MNASPPPVPARDEPPSTRRLWHAGRSGWAIIGIAAAVAVVAWVASHLTVVIVPVVLALFPATLLVPIANWMKHRGVPDALAALLSLVGGLALIGLVIGLMVPLVAAELPQLVEAAGQGVSQVEDFVANLPFAPDLSGGVSGLMERAREQLGNVSGLAGPAVSAATLAIETVTGLFLLLLVLFFFLKDGPRLGNGLVSVMPQHQRGRARAIGARAWETLGRYFRGQLLIALVDALAIGIGLVVLGVPLALPLSVLIFFGGLFPIIGALATGILAILVALADGGFTAGLIVTALVIGVQQLEGNVLEPLILSQAVHLHPLVVILVIAAGAVTFGILGAFLAVPLAAVVARAVSYLREESPEAGTASPTSP